MIIELSNSIIEVTIINQKEKKEKEMNPIPWLLNHVFLNVWIMVCSELVTYDSWNASLQRPNHHTRWGQSLLIIAACAWNEERPSLLSLSLSKINTSLTIPFWAWIISFMKKIPTRITPHTGGQEKISMRKDKKPWKKRGIKAQETQMLGDMSKSLKKWHLR